MTDRNYDRADPMLKRVGVMFVIVGLALGMAWAQYPETISWKAGLFSFGGGLTILFMAGISRSLGDNGKSNTGFRINIDD
ncbi:MAG: hypothetical protein CMI63_21230 [Parvularcula sp.]|nr:hypothetical protein [Parvularcula sp.]